jgi:hypothetical protein
MYRKHSFLTAAVLVALGAGRVLAGGPPMLCLPIDGVTAETVDECTTLLTAKLESKLFPPADKFRPIEVRQFGDQWYLTFYFAEDVNLSEVEKALEDSRFSIPRDRLHFFGHIVLEIDAGVTTPKTLMAGLDALELVSVSDSEAAKDRLLLAVDMPYPAQDFRSRPEALGETSFHWNGLSSDLSSKTDEPATARQLPSYDTLQKVFATNDVKLHDVRWTTEAACRSVGGVAVPEADGKLTKTAQAAIAR